MRMVCWNMQAAFGSSSDRQDRAWHYLHALNPDIALLQETSPPEWARREWHIFHGKAFDHQQWGSAIVVRDGLHPHEMDIPEENRRHQRYPGSSVVLVETTIDMEPYTFGSIYASAREMTEEQVSRLREEGIDVDRLRHGGVQRIWPLYVIFDDLKRLLKDKRFVVGGDFNAARKMDDMPHMAGGNRDFFGRIESGGFHNALGKFHEEEVRTYYKKNNHPYQLDHLHCSSEILERLESCEAIEHPVTFLDLSDHAPIVAEIDLSR